jgi:sorbose reductase
LTPNTGKAYQVDVTDAKHTDDMIVQIVNQHHYYHEYKELIHQPQQVKDFNGRLDIFVANSGIPWTQGPATDGELSHFRKVVTTDFDGTFFCARSCAKIWRRQKFDGVDIFGKPLTSPFTYGTFIATASMSGHIVNIPQLQAAYNAAKAGVIHLVKSLAVEWVKFARANSVSPGYMATEISDFIPPETKAIWKSKIPMGREGEAGELKGVYLFLASEASSYVTGTDVIVDGGYSLP